MNKLYWFSREIPQGELVCKYNGMSLSTIKSLHQDCKVFYFQDSETDMLTAIIEIRLHSATLTCVVENNVCVSALLFSDN